MKAFAALSATALFLILGSSVPAYAQEEHHEQEAKPEKQQQAKPAQHEEKAKPAKQEEHAKPEKQQEQAKSENKAHEQHAKGEQQQEQKQQEQAKNSKQEEQKQAKGQQEHEQKQQQQAKSENHANNEGRQHAQRTASEEKRQRSVPALRLSARGEGRIPEERFHSNFGREHEFRIGSPRLVGGYSRFQYGGFWFGFVQPWPVAWYYTDDVYVDYIDGGYFLCNPYYPDERVSISVVI